MMSLRRKEKKRMLEKYIDTLRPYVFELFKFDHSGHDIGHLERTMKLALYIQSKEGGNRIIVGLAAYLHDIHRAMQKELNTYVEPKQSLDIVKRLLSHLNLSKEEVDEICYCIEYHEQYNWNGNNVKHINALIIQDADNLDAIGAIGIGRCFAYGAIYGEMMYDPHLPLNENDDYVESDQDLGSTIHHFYHKLLKLGNHMNTKTGTLLAQRRIGFMKLFVKEFISEWEGSYE